MILQLLITLLSLLPVQQEKDSSLQGVVDLPWCSWTTRWSWPEPGCKVLLPDTSSTKDQLLLKKPKPNTIGTCAHTQRRMKEEMRHRTISWKILQPFSTNLNTIILHFSQPTELRELRVDLLHLKAGDSQASGGAQTASMWCQQQVRGIFLVVGFGGGSDQHGRHSYATGLQSSFRDEFDVPWMPGHREVLIKPGLGVSQLEADLLSRNLLRVVFMRNCFCFRGQKEGIFSEPI